MGTQLNPYLSFRDTARQAMDFYQSVFGGELTRSTFAEFQVSEDPADQDKIMHSTLTTEKGLVLMGSDTPNGMDYTPGTNYSVSLSGEDETELRATGNSCRRPPPSPCRSTRPLGAIPSECASISSASTGW